MAIKLFIILAMLCGLVSYSHSFDLSELPAISLKVYKKTLARAGYVEVAQTGQSKNLLIETFELYPPASPGHHHVWRIDLTSRGDQVVNVTHAESEGAEVAD